MDWRSLFLFMHLVGITVWVGGMFFAYLCLRPVAAAQLQPPQRLPLWAGVFARFFPWVWIAVLLILTSGLAMMLQVGFAQAPTHWHIMMLLGIAMMLIFGQVFFAAYPRLGRAVAAEQWPQAAAALNQIRRLIAANLTLGLAAIAVAMLGRLIF